MPSLIPRLDMDRRQLLANGLLVSMAAAIDDRAATAASPVLPGADVLARSGFGRLKGRRIGLITNHTGRVGNRHLADLVAAADDVKLIAILAPEHGFRGSVEAGEKVSDDRDPRTGARVLSLYGATRKPTPAMLAGIDLLVFDIQDIGARFYTYISTMGLAMQAAAAARIPFLVLDRPNPLGGHYVAGFVLEPSLRSFVGQFAIPTVHGLTVGELARMIKGERLLSGLDTLELDVLAMVGWRRAMRWPATGLAWVPTSPNIPTFESALVYPGIGMVGELEVSEGRGTPIPFQQFGAPWLDSEVLADRMNAARHSGVTFAATTYRPVPLPGIAAKPRFLGETVNGVRIAITDAATVSPLEIGVDVMSRLITEARGKGIAPIYANDRMFGLIAGTPRLREMLDRGAPGPEIAAAWRIEAGRFAERRRAYLLYPD